MLQSRSVEVVVSPVGAAEVLFERMTGDESLGRLFDFEVDLLSKRGDLHLHEAAGKRMTLALDMGERPPRFFNGVVARFSHSAWTGSYFRYRATLRPWLWLLSRRSNCRIFPNKSVPEILAQIFEEHGFSGEVDGTALDRKRYKKRDYLVQYQETDLNFVTRLMEQAGIFYSFRHAPDRHVLVLADSAAQEAVPGYEQIVYLSPESAKAAAVVPEHIDSWSVGLEVEPMSFAAKEFDFENPRNPLISTRSAATPGATEKLEMFEYPGRYIDDHERDDYVARRLEEQQLPYEVAQGTTNARGIRPGARFRLVDYPAEEQNREYLVTSASYTLVSNDYGSGRGASEADFRCSFHVIRSKRTYRMPVVTPKPVVGGPQTAIVVGQDGEEIWTDKYGRVKVQFHWDRYGHANEESSCWVRVAQVWAGAKWGGIHIPRVGQEVIVDFLEGDPDRPIVTGRVYNKNNMPPYDLPANQTQSGIKTRSTKGGGPTNFNELRFEDKLGEEEVYLQAEKDLTTLVKNDQTTTVQQNRTTSVGVNDELAVQGDRLVHVHGNLAVTVDGAGASGVQSSVSVTGKHTLHATDTIDIEAPTHIRFICGRSSILIEPDKITLHAGGKGIVVVDADVVAESSAGTRLILDPKALLKASGGAAVRLDANVVASSSGGSQVALDGKATLSSPGDVIIDGATTTTQGKSQSVLSGGGSSITAGSPGVDLAGSAIKVAGSASVDVTAPTVKVG